MDQQDDERLRRLGLWSALDVVGVMPPAARWLSRLVSRGVPTLLAFAERDEGVVYLERRMGRRLERLVRSDTMSLVEVAGIDYPMHRHRRRPEMFGEVVRFIEGL